MILTITMMLAAIFLFLIYIVLTDIAVSLRKLTGRQHTIKTEDD